MRFILAAILVAHGIAHLVGFVVPWKLMSAPELPYKTTVLAGRLDVGDAGIRVVGALWLLAAAVLVAAAVAWALDVESALAPTVIGISLSSVLCLAEWPQARIGAFVNVALIFVLMLRTQLALALRS